MVDNTVIRTKLFLKVKEAREQRANTLRCITGDYLQDYLDTKKRPPKDLNRVNAKTGKPLCDYWGNTYKKYSGFWKRWLGKYKEFNKTTVKAWRADAIASGMKSGTFNSELTMLNNYSTYLFDEGVTNRRIVNTNNRKFLPKADIVHYPTLSKVTIQQLIYRLDSKDISAYIKFGLFAGLRAQEVCDLWSFPYDAKKKIISVKGKGGKVRHIKLTKRLDLLRRAVLLYPLRDSSELNRRMKVKLIQIKMKPFSFHSLRATYASNLYKTGTKIEVIARILGHSNIDTTRKYIKSLRDENFFEAINPYEK